MFGYGETEGPLGFPMQDAEAKSLDELIRTHPEAEYERTVLEKALDSVQEDERSDISWIQTDTIDRYHEIVLCSGFHDEYYRANPLITLNHDYYRPPIGQSVWRQRLKEGDRKGIKAKSTYPVRPEAWPAGAEWVPDSAWALIQSGLMLGKSIGFLTLKSHSPSEEEVKKRPELVKVKRIVDEWHLLEYACCWLPCNPEAVTEQISKSLQALRLPVPKSPTPPPPLVVPAKIIAHTSVAEIEKAITRAIESIDLKSLATDSLNLGYDKARGRV